MGFNEFKYERPNYEKIKEKLMGLIDKTNESNSVIEVKELINEINEIRNEIVTLGTIANIRYSINTEDEFYSKEREYWDEYDPLYNEINSEFYKVIVNSKFRLELEKEFGKQFFSIAEYNIKSFSKEVIKDLQLENKLSSEYSKLIASAKIMFEGEERNLSGLTPFILSEDRDMRRRASEAKYKFFTDNEAEIDRLYDEMVKVRTNIAHKLGFKNFVELGYVRMLRTDYNSEMVSKFRDQVKDYIVPIADKLYKRQVERLELDQLKYYDEKFEFLTGNAKPKGNPEWIVNNGKNMYSELSAETKEFFDFMIENDLMDLVTKKGKEGGGYCTYIPNYQSPFIFSNFNGTSGDVDVLTHEAGHAFQCYRSRWISIPECNFPTYESCEIHSMSMEFFTWPWMKLFFEDEEAKYKYSHLGDAIKFIPYGVTVDEFQHFVYENPDATPDERKKAWRNIEKKYLPHKNYEECDFLERGGWWFQQAHIFNSPFYYIDYTLAQICALQFWKKDQDNHEQAWEDYLRLCNVGGTMSFVNLVKHANLISPFEEGCVSSVTGEIDKYLGSIDDKNL